MSFEEIFQTINKPEYGQWMGREDCTVLYEHASRVQGLIVEIGVWMGKSFSLFSLASPESTIIGIDPYPGYEDEYRQFQKNTRTLTNTTLIKMPSDEVFKTWDKPIDFLHVDGEHAYEQVKNDIRWVKFLRKGGVALFHDYTAQALPGVRQALDESGYPVTTVAGFGRIQV